MGRASRLLVAALLPVLLAAATRQAPAPPEPTADLVLTGGRIVTLETPAEAEALAIRGSRIVAVGTADDVRRYVGPGTRVIDLGGQLAIPGFVEGHGHFAGIGEAKLQLDLGEADSWDAIVAMVAAAAREARPGAWIYGRGWHQEKWSRPPSPQVEGFPVHETLSRVSPENPVLLTHASGHAEFANARAMQLSNVTAATPDPPGGDILKDAEGRPVGLFRETAAALIRRGAGEPTPTAAESAARARRVFELASREVLSKGITSFHDAGSTFEEVDLMKTLVDEGRIENRLWIMLRASNAALREKLAAYRVIDHADGLFTVRAIKKSIDGALGSRGAWLLEPYTDQPHTTGHNTSSIAEIRETARLALEHGYQLCVHASATARTAKRWTCSTRPSPGATAARCGGGSSTRSTCIPTTSRDSAGAASSHPCRASTARPTPPTWSRGSAPGARRRGRTSGRR